MKRLFSVVVVAVLFLSVLACQLSPGFQFDLPDDIQIPDLEVPDIVPTIEGAPVPELPENAPDLQVTVNPGDFIEPTVAPTPELPSFSNNTGTQQELLVALYERFGFERTEDDDGEVYVRRP